MGSAKRRAVVGAVVAVTSLTLAACGGGTAGEQPTAAAPNSVRNCGVEVTVTTAPRKAIVIGPAALELVEGIGALGSVSATVGVPIRPTARLGPQARAIRSLQNSVTPAIAQEVLISARPDAILSEFDGSFTADKQGLRTDWAARGVPTFVPRGGCQEANGAVYTTDAFLEDVRQLGVIFDRRAEADRLAGTLGQRITAATSGAPTPPVSVFLYDSGEDAPGTFGGRLFGSVIERAGGRTIFPELGSGFKQTSWEQVAARDPEAIVVTDYSNGSTDEGAKKVAFLRTLPALAGTRAIRDNRIIVVNLAMASPSLTLVDDLERVSAFFRQIRRT